MANNLKSIGFIGSGNVATHLAMALYKAKCEIKIVVSKQLETAQNLSEKVEALASNKIEDLESIQLDLIIIAVNDNQIEEVAEKLKGSKVPVVHTSGATSMNIFQTKLNDYGIFYPLQTLKKERNVNFRKVPICIDANSATLLKVLKALANLIVDSVYQVDDEKRQWLHLSAVFINNNINHVLAKTNDIIIKQKLPKEILQPLLQETIKIANENHPKQNQTGPAIRNDVSTKSIHLNFIKEMEDEHLENLYNVFWNSLQAYHHVTE